MIWTPCNRMSPPKDGVYMVTTVNGKVRFDRFVDGEWGLCNPQCRSGYRPHLAWAYPPSPAQFEERGNMIR